MNNFKNMSKKKSFCNALFNEFFGSILLVLFITYMAAFIILGKAGIFNFIGWDSNIANGFVAAVFFPIVLGLVLLAIVLIVSVLGFIPHKVRAVYNYTYLPLTVDEIRDALDKGIISSKEDYIRLILNSLRYGAMKKPSSWFSAYYITFFKKNYTHYANPLRKCLTALLLLTMICFHILISMMTLILLLTMRNIRVKFCLEI